MTTFPHYLTTLDFLPLKNSFFPAQLPSRSIMIILHGRGGKSEDFSWIAEYFDFDDMHYLMLDAPYVYDEGYAWHDLHGCMQESFTLLRETFDMLFKKEFDPSESFLFGFSQGAELTFEFGARYAKALSGYIAVSGYLSHPVRLLKEAKQSCKKAHWLCTHGTEDEVLDFYKTKEQIEVLQKGGFDITFSPYEKGHGIIKEESTMIYQWIQTLKASY